jgi:hypothetical protein
VLKRSFCSGDCYRKYLEDKGLILEPLTDAQEQVTNEVLIARKAEALQAHKQFVEAHTPEDDSPQAEVRMRRRLLLLR